MMYKNITLIRSIIATSFFLNSVACGNSGVNGVKSPEEIERGKFVNTELKKADKILEELKKEDNNRKAMVRQWENEKEKGAK